MYTQNDIFKCCTPDYKLLKKYGFILKNNKYRYEKLFMNNEFKVIVEISEQGVKSEVYDVENNEEYLPLRVKGEQGSFASAVKSEYLKILEDICAKCFTKKYFITPQANRIAEEIYKNFGDKPEFLWKEYPTCGIFRKPSNAKWYGIIMNIDRSKLDKNLKDEIEIINVKLDVDLIQELLNKKGYYPAWHMNKKYWITMVLDETLPDCEIMNYIKLSHKIV